MGSCLIKLDLVLCLLASLDVVPPTELAPGNRQSGVFQLDMLLPWGNHLVFLPSVSSP